MTPQGIPTLREMLDADRMAEIAESVTELDEEENMRKCVFCETPADFDWYDDNGAWSVCLECIKEGKTEPKGEDK